MSNQVLKGPEQVTESIKLLISDTIQSESSGEIDSVALIGDPFHAAGESILEDYRSMSLETFLAQEARSSMGSYIIVDGSGDERTRLITSLGYCGGYLVNTDGATSVTTTLARAKESLRDDYTFDPAVLEQVLTRNITTRPMYSTLVENVRRLPPAWVVEFDDGEIRSQYGYLERSIAEDGPLSFKSAIEESMLALSQHALRSERTVTVMLSGGVDSLSLLLALRKYLPEDLLRVVSFDMGVLTNGPNIAVPIAEKLGIELTVVESDWAGWPPRTKEVTDHTEEAFAQEYIKSATPHHAYTSDLGDETDILLSGQNMGLWLRGRQAGRDTPYRHGFPPIQSALAGRVHSPILKPFLRHFRFSDTYISSRSLKRAYKHLYGLMYDQREIEYDDSLHGYIKGVIMTQRPNVLADSFADEPEAVYDPDQDIEQFLSYVSSDYTQHTVDQFFYYWYGHNAHKMYSTVSTPSGALAHLPVTWGPFASYYLQRKRGMVDSLGPKRELYQYVKTETGKHYHELTGFSPSELKELREGGSSQSSWRPYYAERHREKFDPETSGVIGRLPDEQSKETVSQLYREVGESIDGDEGRSLRDIGTIESFICTEMIFAD